MQNVLVRILIALSVVYLVRLVFLKLKKPSGGCHGCGKDEHD